jgi:hypothetical protein
VDVILQESTLTNMTPSDMVEAMEQAFALRGCTIEELRLPVEGAHQGITYAGMSVRDIDWEMCRASLAHYLQNSFLVMDTDTDGEWDDFDAFDDF